MYVLVFRFYSSICMILKSHAETGAEDEGSLLFLGIQPRGERGR